jgi:L-amino acid N-acyltransferase YncA
MVGPPMIPSELLREANRDHGTRGRVRRNDRREAIVCEGQVVGFFTPHRAATGEQRIGPVYVRPAFRGRGLATSVYRDLAGPMIACVEDGNDASERLHKRAGFVRWRRYSNGWYWRRG